jgi:hypothetical protein
MVSRRKSDQTQRPNSPRAAASRELVDDIKRVHRDTSGRYGTRASMRS